MSNVASFIFSVGFRCFRGKGKATCLAGERPIPENPFFLGLLLTFLRVVLSVTAGLCLSNRKERSAFAIT